MARRGPATTSPSLTRGRRWAAEALSVVYMAVVAAAAGFTGVATILFPELGALTHDVLARPWGKWAGQPVRLMVTPVLTAVVGTLATRHLPYHVLTILLIVCVSLAIIRLLRSAIAPAISAGVLPLVLGVQSWLYPPGIAAGLVALAAMSILCQRYFGESVFRRSDEDFPSRTVPVRAGPEAQDSLSTDESRRLLNATEPAVPTGAARPGSDNDASEPDVDDILESTPHGGSAWLVALLAFVAVMGTAAQVTGLRFILFPPLIVIAYEMFGHPETCPWSKRPMSLPIACGLTALGGIALVKFLGPGALAAGLGMTWGVLVLRLFDVHMPPALAVGLIPLVMEKPTWVYPGSVTIGTLALTVASLGYNRWALRRRKSIRKSGEPAAAGM